MTLVEHMLLGALGGVARAAVGLIKAMRSDVKIHWGYTFVTVLASGVIGAVAGALIDSDPKISLFAGFVGTDLLDSGYRIIFKKSPVPV